MEAKHILIAIGTFILGGVLGFILNGQICIREMQNQNCHQRMQKSCCPYQLREEGEMKSSECRKHKGGKFLERIGQELNLSDVQKTQIDSIVAIHQDEVGFERGNPENRIKLLESVKKILNEDQKKQLDKIIEEKAQGFFKPGE